MRPTSGTRRWPRSRDPGNYNERQVRRFSQLWELNQTRDLPTVVKVGQWLAAHVPEQLPATVVHGDYRLGNMIVTHEEPERIAAVLDWEMGAIGDPRADVGYLVATYSEPGGRANPLGTSPVMRVTQVTSSTRIAVVCFMGLLVAWTPASGGVLAFADAVTTSDAWTRVLAVSRSPLAEQILDPGPARLRQWWRGQEINEQSPAVHAIHDVLLMRRPTSICILDHCLADRSGGKAVVWHGKRPRPGPLPQFARTPGWARSSTQVIVG